MTTDQQKSIEAVQQAIRMEIDGKEYYLKAAEQTGNELGKKLLKQLAAEEDIHRRVFENIFEEIRNQRGWPKADIHADSGRALRTVFADAIKTMSRDVSAMPEEIDAVETAMGMENKTYDYYRERGQQATHEAEKQFYTALAVQEEEHHRVLLDYYEFLKNPAAWFVQKEHHSLDGG